MNEQQRETPLIVPTARPRQPNYALFFTVIVPIACYLISYLTPSPFKEWGLVGLLVSLGTLALFRTAEEFLDRARARATLPYSIATFLVVAPFAVWGQGIFQQIGLIMYGVIVGVAIFYALVKVTIDEFRKSFLHR